MTTPFTFDVFLSHNSKDKSAVREIRKILEANGIAAWLDEEDLPPGVNWLRLLENEITNSRSIAVIIGKDGLGPWETEEMDGGLRHAVKDGRPVFAILLSDCPQDVKLPMFLGNRTRVNLRNGYTEDGIKRIIWGITGQKPQTITLLASMPEPALEKTEGNLKSYNEELKSEDRKRVRFEWAKEEIAFQTSPTPEPWWESWPTISLTTGLGAGTVVILLMKWENRTAWITCAVIAAVSVLMMTSQSQVAFPPPFSMIHCRRDGSQCFGHRACRVLERCRWRGNASMGRPDGLVVQHHVRGRHAGDGISRLRRVEEGCLGIHRPRLNPGGFHRLL